MEKFTFSYDVVTLQICLALSQTVKQTDTVCYNKSISGNIVKRTEILCLHEHLYVNICKNIIHNSSTWNNQNFHWWMCEISRIEYTSMMEHFAHMRRDGVVTHAKTWDLKSSIKEVSHKDCVIFCHTNMKYWNKHREKKSREVDDDRKSFGGTWHEN